MTRVRAERESRLKKLVEDYRGKGVAIVAIEPNDPDAVRLDEQGYTDVSDGLEDMKIRAAYRSVNVPLEVFARLRTQRDAARFHFRRVASAAL